VDLSEAERIVSGGFGVGGSSGMALLRRLAERMGAALGGTRVAADRGWLEADRFIGSTGKIVTPKLYMAFGVSGAGQHLAGITDSEWVVAVNSDRTAPLLKRADLGVVGDLHQILPCLLDRLEALALSEASSGGGLSDVATPALATTTDPTSRVAEISR
jgi:electron transfer flavoprotein alpha subunit